MLRQPLRREAPEAFVQRLKALQDNLGEHQDAEVHVAQLRELANDLHATSAVDADALLAMGQLTEHLEAVAAPLAAAFVDRFSSYDTKATSERSTSWSDGAAVKTLATYSIKGGVGKTTTAVNLSYEAVQGRGSGPARGIWTPRAPPRSSSGSARR